MRSWSPIRGTDKWQISALQATEVAVWHGVCVPSHWL